MATFGSPRTPTCAQQRAHARAHAQQPRAHALKPGNRNSPQNGHLLHTHTIFTHTRGTLKCTTLHPKIYQQGICQYKIIIKALCEFHYKTAEKWTLLGHPEPPHTRSNAHTHAHTRNSHAHTHAHTRSNLEIEILEFSL